MIVDISFFFLEKKKKIWKLTSTIKILSVGFFLAAYLNFEYEIPPLNPDSNIRQINGSLKNFIIFFFFLWRWFFFFQLTWLNRAEQKYASRTNLSRMQANLENKIKDFFFFKKLVFIFFFLSFFFLTKIKK